MTPGRRAAAALGACFLIAIALLVPGHPVGVRGSYDVAQLVSWMRSPIIGHDLDFTDDVRPAENALPHTITGRTHNAFPIGAPVLWLPFYTAGHVAAFVLRVRRDGYSWPYQLTTLAGAYAYALAGLLLAWTACRRISARGALPAVLIAWGGGFLLYYTHLLPLQAHGTAFFAAALLVTAWLRWVSFDSGGALGEGFALPQPAGGFGGAEPPQPAGGFGGAEPPQPAGGFGGAEPPQPDRAWLGRTCRSRPAYAAAALVGIAGGLATLVRWQAAGLLVLVAFEGLRRGRRGQALLAAAAWAAMFVPQAVAWQILYGAWWRSPRGELAGVFLKWTSPRMAQVLFSPWHGLFAWHPLLAAGAIGLIVLAVRRPRIGLPMLTALAVQAYLNAVAMDWWAGGSFGNRRFDVSMPLLMCGLAALWPSERRLRAGAAALGALGVATNVLVALAFDSGSISSLEPASPGRLLREAVRSAVEVTQRLSEISWLKVAWLVTVAAIALPLVLKPSAAILHAMACKIAALGLRVAIGSLAAVLALAGGLWLLRTPPRFRATTLEAALFASAPVWEPGPRSLAPGETIATYLYVMPGFLPAGAWRVESDTTAPISIRIQGAGAGELALRNGFYELSLRNDSAAAVRVGAVRLRRIARRERLPAPVPLDAAEHMRAR